MANQLQFSKKDRKIIETLKRCGNHGNGVDFFKELQKIRPQFEKDFEKDLLIDVMTALGNEDRLLCVDALKDQDRCACELEAIVGKSQSTVSHHLKILEDAGIIRGWKKGKFTHYSIIQPKFLHFLQFLSEWGTKFSNWFGTIPNSEK